jgi:hypothetical protein
MVWRICSIYRTSCPFHRPNFSRKWQSLCPVICFKLAFTSCMYPLTRALMNCVLLSLKLQSLKGRTQELVKPSRSSCVKVEILLLIILQLLKSGCDELKWRMPICHQGMLPIKEYMFLMKFIDVVTNKVSSSTH